MAKISSANERIISIKSFQGLNENPDGDTNLKNGEAAVMSNFKITDDGSLQIRGGTRDVAGLLPNGEYVIDVAASSSVLVTEINYSKQNFAMRPNISVSSTSGLLTLSGDAVTVNYANAASSRFLYYQDNSGNKYQFDECVYTAANGDMTLDGGAIELGEEYLYETSATIQFYSNIPTVINGALKLGSMVTVGYAVLRSVGHILDGTTPQLMVTRYEGTGQYAEFGEKYRIYVKPVTAVKDNKWEWNFLAVTATTEIADTEVKGIWSGYVNKQEYLVAACGGKLWSLSETDGAWTKTAIGELTTSQTVHFFGMDDKLYMLNGLQYKSWDGTTLSDVVGYIPLVMTATSPGGGGTRLEQVNKLTGLRRQLFSPTGSASDFLLAEKNITSVNWVKLNGVTKTLGSHYEVDLGQGIVSFYSPPASGTNTLEIQWTKGTGERGKVLAMRYAEFYNGATDARVILYGDGTNQILYSGLDVNGLPRMDYFPDSNVAALGDANTPITGLTKHYDTLIAFKENSAYSVTYGTLTFDDGTTNAGFYVLPLNKTIGNTAMGQAMLVENNPRTLDGRSVYEWQGVNSMLTNDQRNAQRISQRIETTLREIDFSKASAYFDKINHEYYIMEGGTALVHNTENDAWYVYRNFPAACMIVYKDEVYIGTSNGYIRHFSRDYLNDNGEPIVAYFESGSMDFGIGYKKKSSRELWISLKPEEYSGLNVTVQTDAQNDFQDAALLSDYTVPASNGVFTSFLELDFSCFSFGTNNKPQTKRLKIRARDFSFYKLIFTSRPDLRATILGADIQASYLGNVR